MACCLSLAVVFLILYLPLCSAHPILLSSSHYGANVQEIRQLNLQRDGYVREIADLQETLEWKDKKIGVRSKVPLIVTAPYASFSCLA